MGLSASQRLCARLAPLTLVADQDTSDFQPAGLLTFCFSKSATVLTICAPRTDTSTALDFDNYLQESAPMALEFFLPVGCGGNGHTAAPKRIHYEARHLHASPR